MLVFERKILRRIYGPKRIEENTYERRTNAELRDIFNEPNIVEFLKADREAGLVTYGEQKAKQCMRSQYGRQTKND